MRFKPMIIGQLLAGVCFASPALAQPSAAPSPPAAPQNPDESVQLGDITITAQRDTQRLQDVPIAVTAVSADNLVSRGMTDTRSIGMSVPNLSLSENGVSVTPFLRGVGSSASGPNDEPSVATYVDGVYIPSPTGNIFSFNNIERIEVLKGPQGTLFGRNATGGVIQIITRDPQHDPSLEASIGYGTHNILEGSAYATTGLGANAAIDLAVVYDNNFDGYGRDIFRNQDIMRREEFAARSKLLITPGSSTEIRLSADYSRLNSTGTDYQLAQGVIGIDGHTTYPGPRRTTTDFQNTGDNEVYGASLRIDQNLGFARLVSISGYRHVTGDFHLDQDATPLPLVRAFINQFARNYSEEVQLLSPRGSSITWLLGGYYFNARFAYTPLTIAGLAAAPFASVDLFGSQNTESYSGYGQATIPLAANTHITAGLRYTHEKQSTVGRTETPGLGVIAPNIAQQQSFDRLTWRIALDHQFTPDILGYVSYNRGIKSGGFNMINAGTPGYAPEVLDAYEAGLKTEFLNRTVRLNTAVFFYDYKDIQVFNITGGGAIRTQNAAAARVYGLDMDLAWRVTPRFTLTAGLGILHSEYTSFPNATFTPASPLQGRQTSGDASGNELVYAPNVSANLSMDYRIPSSTGEFRLNFAVSYRDSVFVSADNRLQIPSYFLANASIGWTSRNDRFGVRLWVRNLFNEDYYANRTEQALGDIQYLAPPITAGITLSTHM
jgi:iron complex outermembrane receptor protein